MRSWLKFWIYYRAGGVGSITGKDSSSTIPSMEGIYIYIYIFVFFLKKKKRSIERMHSSVISVWWFHCRVCLLPYSSALRRFSFSQSINSLSTHGNWYYYILSLFISFTTIILYVSTIFYKNFGIQKMSDAKHKQYTKK